MIGVLLLASGVAAASAQTTVRGSVAPAIDSLVAAERAFAATAPRVGIRAAFLAWFADSAVAFNPEPVLYREAVATSPPQKNPLRRLLRWQPVAGDIAASGDLGYTMGPSIMTDTESPDAEPRYGFYFSVWRRMAGGPWRVVLDIGTEATAAIERLWNRPFSRVLPDTATAPQQEDSLKDRAPRLRDSLFTVRASIDDVLPAYNSVLAGHARIIVEGEGPVEGRDSILAHRARGMRYRVWTPLGAGISEAGDLGYTYGRCYVDNPDSAGYYVRMWRRDAAGVWKLEVEKTSTGREE